MICDFSDWNFMTWWSLSQVKFEIDFGISGLKKMIRINEETILKITEELDLERKSFLKNLEEDDKEYLDHLENDQFQDLEITNWELGRKQRAASLMILFSFFEGKLRNLCHIIEETFDFKIKLKDLSNNEDINWYKTYIEKVFGMEFTSEIEKHFTPIKQQKIVRNLIAHQDSNYDKNQKKKIEICAGLKLIEENDNRGFISIESQEYLEMILLNIEGFLEQLTKAMQTHYEIKINDNIA